MFAVPGPRSNATSPSTPAGKNDVVWWVKSFESPNGTPSMVTLNCPSTKPRSCCDLDSEPPAPLGAEKLKLGVNLIVCA